MKSSYRIWLFLVVLGLIIFYYQKQAASNKAPKISGRLKPCWKALKSCDYRPEYNRTLNEVLISISELEEDLSLQHDLLTTLPAYTRIYFLLPETRLAGLRKWLEGKAYADRIQFVTYDPGRLIGAQLQILFRDYDKLKEVNLDKQGFAPVYPGSLWAQDLCKVVGRNEKGPICVIPCIHKYFSALPAKQQEILTPDNECLFALEHIGIDVMRVPLVFKGGNLIIDKIGEDKILMLGSDILRTTAAVGHKVGRDIDRESLLQTARDTFNVKHLIVLGGKQPQPELMYHLDQALLPLKEGVIGVAKIIGDKTGVKDSDLKRIAEVDRFLTELREPLENKGYQIADLYQSVEDLLAGRHPANSIPYINRETKQRTLLHPRYISDDSSKVTEMLRKKNIKSFKELGYKVIEVDSRANQQRGGPHCLLNVLS